jgi:acetoin utilization protein AcuC
MGSEHHSAVAYNPEFLAYDFGPEHPLRPERITAGLDLLTEADIWNRERETLDPPPASRQELELVHDGRYVHAVQEASNGWFPELARFGLSAGDNPAFPGMHESAAAVTGGSIEAARRLMRGDLAHAFNPAGGLHHAMRARASGFCIYNDPAVAAAAAVEEYGARVMYVDFDCHHGDGVQWLFYADPRVLTVSFHESGRFLFPGTGDVHELGEGPGLGYSINLPMAPFTQDDSWLASVYTVIPALAERFQPDLIISSHGADTHIWDPLTHLALTTRSFFEQAHVIHDLAHRYAQGRWLAVGSGGYDWRRVVPRSWSIVWAEMTGRALPDQIPETWRERWTSSGPEPLPQTFVDPPDLYAPVPRADEITRQNRHTLDLVQQLAGLQQSV